MSKLYKKVKLIYPSQCQGAGDGEVVKGFLCQMPYSRPKMSVTSPFWLISFPLKYVLSAFNKHRRPTKSIGYFAQKSRLLFALN